MGPIRCTWILATGSIALQVMIGGLLAAAAAVRVYWADCVRYSGGGTERPAGILQTQLPSATVARRREKSGLARRSGPGQARARGNGSNPALPGGVCSAGGRFRRSHVSESPPIVGLPRRRYLIGHSMQDPGIGTLIARAMSQGAVGSSGAFVGCSPALRTGVVVPGPGCFRRH